MFRGDPEDLKELERIRRKLDGIRGGPGVLVRNTRDGITISGPPRPPRVAGGDDGGRWGKITAATRLSPNWQWKYTAAVVEKTAAGYGGWTTIADIDPVTAYNATEGINGPAGLMGNGVNVDTLPDGFDLQPVPVGTIVRMRVVLIEGQDAEFWFVFENAVDGTCGGA